MRGFWQAGEGRKREEWGREGEGRRSESLYEQPSRARALKDGWSVLVSGW
jgi:hypothetical protein